MCEVCHARHVDCIVSRKAGIVVGNIDLGPISVLIACLCSCGYSWDEALPLKDEPIYMAFRMKYTWRGDECLQTVVQ